MKKSLFHLALVFCLSISGSGGKILRNNALMSKMVSDFHAPPQNRVVDIMRNVLCKHFPDIPCKVITKDVALRKLIRRTVKLLNDKQRTMQNTTEIPTEQQSRMPVVNSEELSRYLYVENTGYFTEKHKQNKVRRIATSKPAWSDESKGQSHRRHVISGHKNLKKYFPHKIKYKDRNDLEHSREKLSISEEAPDVDLKKHEHFNYKNQPSDLPVWQIDYTKHGEPRLAIRNKEKDQLKGKLVKIGTDAEDMGLNKYRKGVLQPNLYIKNSAKKEVDIHYKK